MSQTYEFNDGKDLVIFASPEDHKVKSTIKLPVLQSPPGITLPNGDINWLCPCLGGLATGPCGVPFRKAFTCFHVSKADPKGSDCVGAFKEMQDCMIKNPKIYRNDNVPTHLDTDDDELRSLGPQAAELKMSYCRRQGKDTIIFATKEDHAEPSKVTLPELEPSPGLILPSGEINWNCPCLGGMATGPCGIPFREAFSCFHYSTADPKGSDCFESFTAMQSCMQQYPAIYDRKSSNEGDEEFDIPPLDEAIDKDEAQANTLAAEKSEVVEKAK